MREINNEKPPRPERVIGSRTRVKVAEGVIVVDVVEGGVKYLGYDMTYARDFS